MSSPKLYVISCPSGSGESDIISNVISSRDDIATILPVSSRKMKASDVNGKGMYFFDLEQWDEMIASGDLIEKTTFAGNDYGTSKKLITEQFEKGKNVVLSIEIDRAKQIKQNMPEAVIIYIAPEDESILRERYSKTARNSFETDIRLNVAKKLAESADFCDIKINSNNLEVAEKELNSVIS